MRGTKTKLIRKYAKVQGIKDERIYQVVDKSIIKENPTKYLKQKYNKMNIFERAEFSNHMKVQVAL